MKRETRATSPKPRRPRCSAAAISLTVVCVCSVTVADNVDPDNDGSQYAWAENAGWISAEQDTDGDGTPDTGVTVADFSLSGWLWGENLGWISLSCSNTSSCGAVDYGVTNDGAGSLAGHAWAENAGWVNFAPSTSDASIDPATGEFGGYVWAENLGWVSLSCTNTASCGTVDYGIKTDWCLSVAAAPAGTADIDAARSGSDVQLSWPALAGADWYEVVRGELGALRSTGGDYASATDGCVSDNETGTTVVVSGTPAPAPGDGYWYLVRGVNCKGKGTYDTGGAGQIGTRDAEIGTAGSDCP